MAISAKPQRLPPCPTYGSYAASWVRFAGLTTALAPATERQFSCLLFFAPPCLHAFRQSFTHGQGHLQGDNAAHPIAPRWRLLAALLLVAGRSWQRRRLAGRSQARGLPSSRCPSVRGHTWSRSAHLAGRRQARGLPSSRCPGVRGHTWRRSARLAGRSQARGLPSSRCPGVRGHTWSRTARLAGRSQAKGLPSSRCPGVRRHTWSRSAQPCPRTLSQATRARPSAASRLNLVTNLEGGPMTGSLCVTAGQGSTSSTISALRNRSTRTWPRPLAGVNTPPPGGSRWPP